jgi:hypothetical protein
MANRKKTLSLKKHAVEAMRSILDIEAPDKYTLADHLWN